MRQKQAKYTAKNRTLTRSVWQLWKNTKTNLHEKNANFYTDLNKKREQQ